jgi:hypothetical protein
MLLRQKEREGREALPSSSAATPAPSATADDRRHAKHSGAPRALVLAVLGWPSATRLSIALAAAGFSVAALAPLNHWIHRLRRLDASFSFRPYASGTSSAVRAIRAWQPDVLVPCDDPGLFCVLEMHAQAKAAPEGNDDITALLRASLGDDNAAKIAAKKSAFIPFAAALGLDVPPTVRVRSLHDLQARLARVQFPQVLKVDSTWGGNGVRVVRNQDEAERAYAILTSLGQAWSSRLAGAFSLGPRADWRRAEAPTMTLQDYVPGVPANRAVACWHGEVLAGLSVQAVETYGLTGTGPATVVRVIEHKQMEDAATRLVRELRLSGFYGFDFVIEDGTGRAVLLEMNSRATPTCYLAPNPTADLCGALFSQLAGTRQRAVAGYEGHDVIALFPQELWRDPKSRHLRAAFHDVPWEEPDFISAHARPPSPHWVRSLQSSAKRLLGLYLEPHAPAPVTLGPNSQLGDQGPLSPPNATPLRRT